ncbi:MAG: penicillin-binding protein 1A [Alphaproteobacteria bacterium]|nr:penicillin-binding protein 1A [Alphaproteobacteria bacterium]
MKRFFIYLFSFLVFSSVAGVCAGVFIFYHFGKGLPNYKHLATYEPPVVTRMYANDGRLFAEYAHEKRVFVPIEAIPQRLIKTFLAAEDKNFYEHFGIDIPSIFRSVFLNIKRSRDNKRPVGASTITQQVARNFLLADIANQVSLNRKIKEAILSIRIEQAYTKDHILELYMNEIFLGNNSYGVAAAALNYFNKTLDQLTVAEAAYLAGLPKAPSRYNPRTNMEAAINRRNWVISRMLEEDVITQEQADEAVKEPITLRQRDSTEVVSADYFAEEVRRHLLKEYGEEALYQGGLTVRTTVDPKLQSIAERAMREGLISYDRRHGWRGALKNIDVSQNWQEALSQIPKPAGTNDWKLAVVLNPGNANAEIGLLDGTKGQISLKEMEWARKWISSSEKGPAITSTKMVVSKGDVILVESMGKEKENTYKLCQIPKVSGGMVVIDPHTGRVLAMQGGFDFRQSQYNRATQANRQPGSCFKPFVYLAALERGMTPSTKIMDAPFAINMGYGLGVWAPKNYNNEYGGATTLRVALEKSRNLVTVRLVHDRVGMKKIVETAKRFNIMNDMPMQLAMVLGAGETTLLRLTAAYAAIVNGGKEVTPIFFDRIQDRKGKSIKINDYRVCKGCDQQTWVGGQNIPELLDQRKELTSEATAYQITSILQGVVDRGTGKVVRTILGDNRPVGGKTGTSNDFFDSWFVGFTPDLVVGAYVGFDEPKTLGPKETGSKNAAPIVANFLKEALKDQPAVLFRAPPGIKFVKVDRESGEKTRGDGPGIITEAFKIEDDTSQDLMQVYTEEKDSYNNPGEEVPYDSNPDDLNGTGGLY